MFEAFSATLSAMLTMFFCIFVGFILRKKKLEPEDTDCVLSKLLNYALAPALTFSTFSQNFNVHSLIENYSLILYSCLILGLAVLLAGPLSRLFAKEGYVRNIYKYAMAFANYGYMGNAIVLVIFGSEILYYYMLFTIPFGMVCYSWGMAQLIPGKGGLRGTLVRILNPSTLAMGLGILAGLLNLKTYIPEFLSTALSNLGNCMGPIAMVLTGYVVGIYDMKKMLTNKKIYLATALRLTVLPALFCSLLLLLGADKLVLTLTLVAFATPLGLNTVVFPAAYGADTSIGAGMALISHVLSVITFPLIYMLFTAVIH